MPCELSEAIARIKARAAEHEARMASDPAYRAAEEARLAALEADRVATAQRDRERARRAAWARAGIPEREQEALAHLGETRAVQAVRRFLAGPETFLILTGTVGCGKTTAACVALDGRERGMFVKALAVQRLRFDDEAWPRVLSASALVVDDLGREPLDAKGWGDGAFAELFDARYDAKAKTVITANLTLDAFRARYLDADGGRFLSRLRQAGAFEVVAGDDLRRAHG